MQDTTRVINAVETWQTVIVNENEQVIADQANQHTYIDGTGVAAVIIDTGVDAGHPDFDDVAQSCFLNLIELLELG